VTRALCAAILVLEAVVLALTTPVLIAVAGVGEARALATGLGLAAACLVTAGLLRWRWAYVAGWAVQVAAVALGLLVPMMVVLGVLFAALWAGAYLLGRKIDGERAERAGSPAAWDAEHTAPGGAE
jgi:hypothetical protein